MKIETTFLHSKLARRIFWLFVLCALIPITVLAAVSLRNVTAQLEEQSRRQLHQLSRDEAMAIYERLNFLEADLKLVGVSVRDSLGSERRSYPGSPGGLVSNLVGRFDGLELVFPDGSQKSLFGKDRQRIGFTPKEQEFLRSGKSVLSAVDCGERAPCVFLNQRVNAEHPNEGTLVAEIQTPYLWDADSLPQDMNVCVLDPSGRALFCSAEPPTSFPTRVTHTFSGEFEWRRNGQEFLANYWNLPLESSFLATHWTIVTSEAKPDVLAPLARFKASFLLVFLLALWIVLLLSLVQIRRHLIPLGRLKEGTRRISLGDFQSRVTVTSGDEFSELADSFNSMSGRIERQLHSFKVINEIDRAILSAWNIEKIVDTLSKKLGELLPHDLLSLVLFDSAGTSMATTYVYGPALDGERHTEKIGVTPEEMRELADQQEVSVLAEGGNLPSYLRPLSTRGMKCFLRVPVCLDGRPSAVFTLGRATVSAWTEEDTDHARQLANQLAVALANSRLVSELEQLHWGTLTALARAIDAKSPWTLGHSERVTSCAIKMAEAMGLSTKELDVMRRGGLLHDVGKIGTPAEILDKPGKLTDDEMKQMREHVNIGARILQPIPGLADSMSIVLQHHEWVNGGGYPNGLSGDKITLHARIFAVADCFDALISDRPYRPGMAIERVMQIIEAGEGKQFDPLVVDVFRGIMEQGGFGTEREEAFKAMVEVS
jgi:putative nucleotidyltransferase with HDIG domain